MKKLLASGFSLSPNPLTAKVAKVFRKGREENLGIP
jgi:hypothetical protein